MSISQPELNQPRRNGRLRDLAKRTGRLQSDRRWEPEHGMVPHVENVRAEFKIVTFLNPEALLN